MARTKTYEPDKLADCALAAFWQYGFNATSMDDLVKATKVSRHGIYSDFGGKKELFLACFKRYELAVVAPAIEAVEKPNADIRQIADYFEHQIALAERAGLPSNGCFVANASTEVAPQDADVAGKVNQHNDRLAAGFSQALRNSNSNLATKNIEQLAEVIVVFANGLWSLSRSVTDAAVLRDRVTTFLTLIREQLK
ncbi:MAG: TetR/AcrR family transcriptional regulator [Pseudomonadota bacterium]